MPFAHLPLGQRIPASPHAVSASLPTMRDVRGYEEKNPETMRLVASAYPRFVVNPFIVRLAEHFVQTKPALAERTLWFTSSARMAEALAAHLKTDATIPRPARTGIKVFSSKGIHGVSHPKAATAAAASAKTYLQNLGGFMSSREAEDHLVRLGVIEAAFPEPLFQGDAVAEVHRVLRRALPECEDGDLLLANSGMSAVYAAFRASSAIQAPRGRTVWLQLGWLYRDSIVVLQKFTEKPSDYVYVRDPVDFDAIARILRKFGSRIAGIITEVPTNPLIETPDLPALSQLCREQGVHLIVDPSVASVFAVDVLKYSDVLASSLTKYTSSEGDILGGLVAINPASPDAAELRTRTAEFLEPLYARDCSRLAVEIAETETVIAKINENARKVATFLSNHPKVRDVFWALQPSSKENYRRIARTPDATGGMISFTLKVPMEPFHDRLRLPKGPSFGMKTTLICPFMYLAHYDLVTTPAGVAELAASRLDPDLLRLCVGIEPAEEIIDAINEALAGPEGS